MKFKVIFSQGLLLLVMMSSLNSMAQHADNFWRPINSTLVNEINLQNRIDIPQTELLYRLDFVALKSALQNAPDRKNANAQSNVVLGFPNAKGDIENYAVFNAPVIHEALQNKYPELGSFIGKNLENPSKIIRFSVSSNSLQTITLNDPNGAEYINPVNNDQQHYSVFYRRDLPGDTDAFECHVVDAVEDETSGNRTELPRNASDGQLREFRMALGCTEEYAAFHVNQAGLSGGTDAQKKAAVLAVMNSVMTRVNAVYENDIAITMILVPTNENVIFLSSPFLSNNNLSDLINQSQQFIDAFIGTTYDIGHMLNTGPGGLAQLFSPCTPNKARGVSGSSVPSGAGFEGVFMHELGHQYGSPHTFNGNTGSCTNNRTASSAYETGSGTTILAYPGICGIQNVQSTRDLYFHQRSLETMWANVSAGASTCANLVSTSNAVPVVEAGNSFTIPIGTPYKLTGLATDADGTASLTYAWEQYDLGPSGVPSPTTMEGPLVRSFPPNTSPVRFIPTLPDLLTNGGTSTQWEQLPIIERTINFRLTVRDNDTRGGQAAFDVMSVNTVASGFFVVTSQNTVNLAYDGGSTQTVTWNVGGTTGSGVNTANVNILLSINGGESFDIVLAANTPNDGSQDVVLPNVEAPNSRIMVEAVGNIFFNVNQRAFQIQEQLSVDDNELANNIKIFPNPNNGTFNIQLRNSLNEKVLMSLYDLGGRLIHSQSIENFGETNNTISLNNLSTGVYLLKIIDGNRELAKKLIVN